MKALNYLKNISLTFGGSLLLFGCSWDSDTLEDLPEKPSHAFEVVYEGGSKVDTVIAYTATFDHYTMCAWFMDRYERIISVYYDVERVEEINKR